MLETSMNNYCKTEAIISNSKSMFSGKDVLKNTYTVRRVNLK